MERISGSQLAKCAVKRTGLSLRGKLCLEGKSKPITLRDVTIIDDAKLRKAITAASLGNAMEWFDFGVYGFVAYALGKVFFPVPIPACR